MKRFVLPYISFIMVLTTPLLDIAQSTIVGTEGVAYGRNDLSRKQTNQSAPMAVKVAAPAAATPSLHGAARKEILILNSYHPGYAWSDDEQAGIIDVLSGEYKDNGATVVEYLDLKRLPDGKHLGELRQLFRRKYQNRKFSVVIAIDNPALEFAVDNQSGLFRNAPIVFCGINHYTAHLLKGRPDVTGIVEAIDIAGTIELMLRMHPATQEIFSSQDNTVTGAATRKELEALVPRFGAKIRFRITDHLTREELLKELERLPKDSLVLEMGFTTDKSGRTFNTSEIAKLVTERSPVPVYSTYEQKLGFGIVGGRLLSPRIHGANCARIALLVLAGGKASAIPVDFENDSQFMFDYKVMSRFGIPLTAVPEGSTVINNPVSFYTTHRGVIQAALGIIGFLLIVASLLVVILIQKRRSATALRASEAKYLDFYENAPDMYVSVDAKTAAIVECNNTLVEATGYSKKDILGRPIFEMYLPACRENAKRVFQQFVTTGEVRDAELILMHKSGSTIDVSLNISAVRDIKGRISRSRGILRDIIKRKKIEKSLHESEERYRNLITRAVDGICIMSTNGQLVEVNESFARMHGYSVQEMLVMNLRNLDTPDTTQLAAERMRRIVAGEALTFDVEHYHKDGHIFPLEVSANLISYDGESYIQSFHRDITERKRAEEALQKSEAKFRSVFDWANDAIMLHTPAKERMPGRFVEINQIACRMLGYSRSDLLAMGPADIVPAGLHPLFAEINQQAATTESLLIETRLRRKDGTTIPVESSSHLINYDGMRVWISHIRDIAKRKKAEDALQAANVYNRSLIEASLDPLVTIGADGKIADMNAATEAVTGYTRAELIDTEFSDYFTDPEQARAGYREAFRAGSIHNHPLELRHRDGHLTSVLYNASVYRDEKGRTVGVFAAARDITERRQAEEALHASREQLRALAGRLQAAREEERTNMARKIHDELGGALTGLKIDLSFLTRASFKIEDAAVRRSLLEGMESMITGIDEAIHSVRRIAMELRPGVLDDLGLIEALKWQLTDFEKRTGVRCKWISSVNHIDLDADLSTALFRIFQETLTNVARHSGATEVRVRLRADQDSSTLEVEDNGKGIEKKELTSSRSLGFLGMRERAQTFGGWITVTGTPGRGTTVTITIPPVEKEKIDRDQGGDAE